MKITKQDIQKAISEGKFSHAMDFGFGDLYRLKNCSQPFWVTKNADVAEEILEELNDIEYGFSDNFKEAAEEIKAPVEKKHDIERDGRKM